MDDITQAPQQNFQTVLDTYRARAKRYGWEDDINRIAMQQLGYVPSYWEEPRRLARFHNIIQSALPGQTLPDWIDRDAIESAYEYMKWRNKDADPSQWRFLNVADPIRATLREMPTPPVNYLYPNEIQYAPVEPEDLARADQPTDAQAVEPEWMRTYRDIMGHGWAMGGSVGLMASIQNVVEARSLSPLLFGPLFGAGMGELAQKYQEQMPWLMQALNVLDVGAEGIERIAGLGAQLTGAIRDPERFGSVAEFFKNIGPAWLASSLAYDVGATGAVDILNLFSGETKAERGEVWQFEHAEPVQLEMTELDKLLWVRRQIENMGSDPDMTLEDLRQQVIAEFGLTGMTRDLIGHIFLDPLNIASFLGSTSLKGLGLLTKNQRLIKAATIGRGFVGTLGAYGTQARIGVELGEDAAKMSRFSRWLAGVDAEGKSVLTQTPKEPTVTSRFAAGTFSAAPAALVGYGAGSIVSGLTGVPGLGPLGAAVTGGLSFRGGYKGGLANLFKLGPASKALEIVNLSAGSLSELVYRSELSPSQVYDLVAGVARTPDLVARQLGTTWINSPEAAAIPMALKDYLPEIKSLVEVWERTTPNRLFLEELAYITGKSKEQVLVELSRTDKPEILLKAYIDAASQMKDQDPRAAAIIKAYAEGVLTSETLTDIVKTFFLDGIPCDIDNWKGQFFSQVMEHMSRWAAETFGVKPDPTWARLSAVVKSAQNLLLLGLNPGFFVVNVINNSVTAAAAGVFGFVTPKQALKMWERMGLKPPRLRAGAGAAASGIELNYEAIRSAATELDKLEIIHRGISRLNEKVGVFTKLSGAAEQFASLQTMTAGYKQAWRRLWKRGVGFEKLPYGLEAKLSGIHKDLPNLVYGLIEAGYSKAEIEAALWEGSVRWNIDSMLPKLVDGMAERGVYLTRDDLIDLLESSGVYDTLREGLEGARSEDDVRRVFADLTKSIDSHLTDLTNERIVGLAQDALAKTRLEGAQSALDIYNKMQLALASAYYDHIAGWEEVYAITENMSQPERRAIIAAHSRLADLEWRKIREVEAAQYSGIGAALGMKDELGKVFMEKLGESGTNWDEFFTVKNRKIREFFDTNFKSRERRNAAWNDLQDELMQMYRDHARTENLLQEQMDNLFVAMFERQFGEGTGDPARAWREGVREIRNRIVGDMVRFRQEVAKVPIGERNELWLKYNHEVRGKQIMEMFGANLVGANKLFGDVQTMADSYPVSRVGEMEVFSDEALVGKLSEENRTRWEAGQELVGGPEDTAALELTARGVTKERMTRTQAEAERIKQLVADGMPTEQAIARALRERYESEIKTQVKTKDKAQRVAQNMRKFAEDVMLGLEDTSDLPAHSQALIESLVNEMTLLYGPAVRRILAGEDPARVLKGIPAAARKTIQKIVAAAIERPLGWLEEPEPEIRVATEKVDASKVQEYMDAGMSKEDAIGKALEDARAEAKQKAPDIAARSVEASREMGGASLLRKVASKYGVATATVEGASRYIGDVLIQNIVKKYGPRVSEGYNNVSFVGERLEDFTGITEELAEEIFKLWDEIDKFKAAQRAIAESDEALAFSRGLPLLEDARSYTRDTLLQTIFRLPEEEVEVTMAMMDAMAQHWALENNSTPNEFYSRTIAGGGNLEDLGHQAALFNDMPVEKNLGAYHALSEESFLAIINAPGEFNGKIVVPSLAINVAKHWLAEVPSFGDVVLLATPDQVLRSTGEAHYFTGDWWTPKLLDRIVWEPKDKQTWVAGISERLYELLRDVGGQQAVNDFKLKVQNHHNLTDFFRIMNEPYMMLAYLEARKRAGARITLSDITGKRYLAEAKPGRDVPSIVADDDFYSYILEPEISQKILDLLDEKGIRKKTADELLQYKNKLVTLRPIEEKLIDRLLKLEAVTGEKAIDTLRQYGLVSRKKLAEANIDIRSLSDADINYDNLLTMLNRVLGFKKYEFGPGSRDLILKRMRESGLEDGYLQWVRQMAGMEEGDMKLKLPGQDETQALNLKTLIKEINFTNRKRKTDDFRKAGRITADELTYQTVQRLKPAGGETIEGKLHEEAQALPYRREDYEANIDMIRQDEEVVDALMKEAGWLVNNEEKNTARILSLIERLIKSAEEIRKIKRRDWKAIGAKNPDAAIATESRKVVREIFAQTDKKFSFSSEGLKGDAYRAAEEAFEYVLIWSEILADNQANYFEVKIKDAVPIRDFGAALVPQDVNPAVATYLRDEGIPQYAYLRGDTESFRKAHRQLYRDHEALLFKQDVDPDNIYHLQIDQLISEKMGNNRFKADDLRKFLKGKGIPDVELEMINLDDFVKQNAGKLITGADLSEWMKDHQMFHVVEATAGRSEEEAHIFNMYWQETINQLKANAPLPDNFHGSPDQYWATYALTYLYRRVGGYRPDPIMAQYVDPQLLDNFYMRHHRQPSTFNMPYNNYTIGVTVGAPDWALQANYGGIFLIWDGHKLNAEAEVVRLSDELTRLKAILEDNAPPEIAAKEAEYSQLVDLYYNGDWQAVYGDHAGIREAANEIQEAIRVATDNFRQQYGDVVREIELKERELAHAERVVTYGRFRQGHFKDRFSDYVYHLRFADRYDVDGKLTFVIEEIQSDWIQRGRDEGFKESYEVQQAAKADYDAAVRELNDKGYRAREGYENQIEISREWVDEQGRVRRDEIATLHMMGVRGPAIKYNHSVPEDVVKILEDFRVRAKKDFFAMRGTVEHNPFEGKIYWQNALRRLIKRAASNGYDRIALTTGEEQSARYGVQAHYQSIDVRVSPTSGLVTATGTTHNGYTNIIGSSNVLPYQLVPYLGVELAQKIENQWLASEPQVIYTGLDLQVGKEGMMEYYDKYYPSYIETLNRKYKWNTELKKTRVKQSNLYYTDTHTNDVPGSNYQLVPIAQTADGKFEITDPTPLYGGVKMTFDTIDEARDYIYKLDTQEVYCIDVTPEMVEWAKGTIPLFQRDPRDVLGMMQNSGVLPDNTLVRILDAQDTKGHIAAAATHLVGSRTKLIKGEMTAADVAKAIALSLPEKRMRIPYSDADQFKLRDEGLKDFFNTVPSEYVTFKANNKKYMTSRSVIAYWLTTKEGQDALRSLETGYDPNKWSTLLKINKVFRLGSADGLMFFIKGLVEDINSYGTSRGGADALKKLSRYPDMTEARLTDFVKHIMGFGDDGQTLKDLEVWLKGDGDVISQADINARIDGYGLQHNLERPDLPKKLKEQIPQDLIELYEMLGEGMGQDVFTNTIYRWLLDKADDGFSDPQVLKQQRFLMFAMGATLRLEDGRAMIYALRSPNFATFIHEIAHVMRRHISAPDLAIVEDWAGVKNGFWEVHHEEKFARAFERYVYEGRAPRPDLIEVFDKAKRWMMRVYAHIRGTSIDVEISPELREVFDRMFGGTIESKAAETSGMPPGPEPPRVEIPEPQAATKLEDIEGVTIEPDAPPMEPAAAAIAPNMFDDIRDSYMSTGDVTGMDRVREYRHGRMSQQEFVERAAAAGAILVRESDERVGIWWDDEYTYVPKAQVAYFEWLQTQHPSVHKQAEGAYFTFQNARRGAGIDDTIKLMEETMQRLRGNGLRETDTYYMILESLLDEYKEIQNLVMEGTPFFKGGKFHVLGPDGSFVEIPGGNRVNPSPHLLDLDFIAHQRYSSAGKEIPGTWTITEASTGVTVAGDYPTMHEAVLSARSILNHDPVEFRASIVKRWKEGNVSPSYEIQKRKPDVEPMLLMKAKDPEVRLKELTARIKKEARGNYGYTKTQAEYILEQIIRRVQGLDLGEVRDNYTKPFDEPLVIDVPDGGRMTITSYQGLNTVYFSLSNNTYIPGWRELRAPRRSTGLRGQQILAGLGENYGLTKNNIPVEGTLAQKIYHSAGMALRMYGTPDSAIKALEAQKVRVPYNLYDAGEIDLTIQFLRKVRDLPFKERLTVLMELKQKPKNTLFQEWEDTATGPKRPIQDEDGNIVQYQDGDGEIRPVEGETEPVKAVGAPLGTVDAQKPAPDAGEVQREGWSQYVKPLLDVLQKQMLDPDNAKPSQIAGMKNTLGPEELAEFRKYMHGVYGQMSDAKIASLRWAENRRDAALLNYNRRYGFDNVISAVYPYHFWYTRTALNWAYRAIDNPSWFANYARLKQYQNRVGEDREGYPSRLKGKLRIPMPFLPDWMGDSVYIDPYKQAFPFAQFAQPLENRQQEVNQQMRRAQYIVQQRLNDGQISEEDAQQALGMFQGQVWDDAMRQAEMEIDMDVTNPFDFINTMMGPSLPIGWMYNWVTGRKDRISQLPATKTIQAISALAGANQGRGWNIEAPIRRAFGMPEEDRFADYRVDRELANMATEGNYTVDEIMRAMVDKSGPIYLEAEQRQAKIKAIKTLGGNAVGTDFFPEGEAEQRALKIEFDRAMDAKSQGDTKALTKFFDKYPEYEARMMLFIEDPEERLRRFIIGQIWDSWENLPALHKTDITEELGDLFEQNFLEKETRSYDTISTQTLATWASVMGQTPPEKAGEVPDVDIDMAPPEIAQAYEEFTMQRNNMFGPAMAKQKIYFTLQGQDQDQYLLANPDLKEYWAWKDQYLAEHPEIIPYAISEENELSRAEPETQALVYQFRAQRNRMFPDAFELQDAYYNVDKADRSAFLAQYPQLEGYWEWRRNWIRNYPQIVPYIMSAESIADKVLGETPAGKEPNPANVIQYNPVLLRQLRGYFFADQDLGSGTLQELMRIWYELGEPGGTFEEFIDTYVHDYILGIWE